MSSKLIERALEIATKAHEGQVDKAGSDYINHPIKVASFVDGEFEKVVALLHDVVEDTQVTLDDLAKEFPKEIILAIKLLTKPKFGFDYDKYFNDIKSNELAKAVKLADLKHNSDLSRIKSPTAVDIKRVEKYKKAIAFLLN